MSELLSFLKPAHHAQGALVLIGGAEDRARDREVLRRAIEVNQAGTVAVIPTATSYPREAGEDYQRAFKAVGAADVHILDIRYQDEADRPEHLEIIERSDLIFFTGGDQVRLVEILKDSALIATVKKKHADGATIAGTSAGAAAASHPMIYSMDYDNDNHGFYKHSVLHSDGFGFLNEVTIDTHFLTRQRLSRLVQFLCSGLSKRGIGLAEDTGIIVTPDNTFTVIGSSLVTVLSSAQMSYTNYHEPPGGPHGFLEVDGITLGFLAAGSTFDIKHWKILRN